ncbi:MAG: alpha/beta hydrolase [Bacteroidales bacterium]|nr:alpha/beta hydrolase [Bacteroidales bacterium]
MRSKLLITKMFVVILLSVYTVENLSAKDYGFRIKVTGKGTDMILIPGLACSGDVWENTVDHYSANYRCHILTLPGFDKVKEVDFGLNYSDYITRQVLSYINDNNINKPIIVGHSLGGFISLKIAIADNDIASKYIIVDALPFLPAIMNPMATIESSRKIAEGMRAQMKNRKRGEGADFLRPMMRTMVTDTLYAEKVVEWGVNSHAPTVAQANYELYTTDLREQLKVIKSPILVMGSWIAYKNYGVTHDITMHNYKGQYAKAENCTVVLSDDARHFIMIDNPEFFFTQIDRFIN